MAKTVSIAVGIMALLTSVAALGWWGVMQYARAERLDYDVRISNAVETAIAPLKSELATMRGSLAQLASERTDGVFRRGHYNELRRWARDALNQEWPAYSDLHDEVRNP
jgi:hypothetical protein